MGETVSYGSHLRLACVSGSGCPCPSPDVRSAHPGLRSLDADCAPASMPALVSNAGSRGTGSPSLSPVAQAGNLCVFRVSIGLASSSLAYDSGRGSSPIGGTRRSRCDLCLAAVAPKRLSRELTSPAGAEHVSGRLRRGYTKAVITLHVKRSPHCAPAGCQPAATGAHRLKTCATWRAAAGRRRRARRRGSPRPRARPSRR